MPKSRQHKSLGNCTYPDLDGFVITTTCQLCSVHHGQSSNSALVPHQSVQALACKCGGAQLIMVELPRALLVPWRVVEDTRVHPSLHKKSPQQQKSFLPPHHPHTSPSPFTVSKTLVHLTFAAFITRTNPHICGGDQNPPIHA